MINEINLINKIRTEKLDNLKHIIKKFIITFYKFKYSNLSDIIKKYRYRLLYNDDKLRTVDRKYKTRELKLPEEELEKILIEEKVYSFNVNKNIESNDITQEDLYKNNEKRGNKDEIEEESIQNTTGTGHNIEDDENDDGEVYGAVEAGEPVYED